MEVGDKVTIEAPRAYTTNGKTGIILSIGEESFDITDRTIHARVQFENGIGVVKLEWCRLA